MYIGGGGAEDPVAGGEDVPGALTPSLETPEDGNFTIVNDPMPGNPGALPDMGELQPGQPELGLVQYCGSPPPPPPPCWCPSWPGRHVPWQGAAGLA
jgi:hypothetical protein